MKTVPFKMDKAFGTTFHAIIPGRMLFVGSLLCTSGVKFQDRTEVTAGIRESMPLHVSVLDAAMIHLTDTIGVSILNRLLHAKVREELDGTVNASITGKLVRKFTSTDI